MENTTMKIAIGLIVFFCLSFGLEKKPKGIPKKPKSISEIIFGLTNCKTSNISLSTKLSIDHKNSKPGTKKYFWTNRGLGKRALGNNRGQLEIKNLNGEKDPKEFLKTKLVNELYSEKEEEIEKILKNTFITSINISGIIVDTLEKELSLGLDSLKIDSIIKGNLSLEFRKQILEISNRDLNWDIWYISINNGGLFGQMQAFNGKPSKYIATALNALIIGPSSYNEERFAYKSKEFQSNIDIAIQNIFKKYSTNADFKVIEQKLRNSWKREFKEHNLSNINVDDQGNYNVYPLWVKLEKKKKKEKKK